MQFGLQDFAGRENSQVLSDANVALVELQQFDVFLVFSGTEDQANRRILAIDKLVFFEVTQVQFHLAFVGGFELPDLQVDSHQTPQPSMIKQQVNCIVAVQKQPLQERGNRL